VALIHEEDFVETGTLGMMKGLEVILSSGMESVRTDAGRDAADRKARETLTTQFAV
jgi:hypothetical protein